MHEPLFGLGHVPTDWSFLVWVVLVGGVDPCFWPISNVFHNGVGPPLGVCQLLGEGPLLGMGPRDGVAGHCLDLGRSWTWSDTWCGSYWCGRYCCNRTWRWSVLVLVICRRWSIAGDGPLLGLAPEGTQVIPCLDLEPFLDLVITLGVSPLLVLLPFVGVCYPCHWSLAIVRTWVGPILGELVWQELEPLAEILFAVLPLHRIAPHGTSIGTDVTTLKTPCKKYYWR